MKSKHNKSRSKLPKELARQRYVEVGEVAVLEQIKKDAQTLDAKAIAVGPFTRLDANDVAAHDGKTRGVISNLFGNQANLQAETMALALSAGEWINASELPAPDQFPAAEHWLDAFLDRQSARGPQHGNTPALTYAFLWVLWLGVLPYGLWSEKVAQPSLEEYRQSAERLKQALGEALDHFGMTMREGTTLDDLACALMSLIEGVWLNQCLTGRHPLNPSEPIATVLRNAGRMLWRGATQPGLR